jgi:WD40 repeat protein
MQELDRRDFLRAAVPLGLSAAMLEATSPPPIPPPKVGDTLKEVTTDEVLKLPAEAAYRLGQPRLRIPGYVNAIQFSPRGTTLVGASGTEIRAWDPATGKVKFRVSYPEGSSVDAGRLTNRDTFTLMLHSNTGSQLRICHYEFGTARLVAVSKPLSLAQGQSMVFSLDGRLAASAGQDGLSLFDAVTGDMKWNVKLAADSVGTCEFFPDASLVFLALPDRVDLYSVATGKLEASLKSGREDREKAKGKKRGQDFLQSVAVSPDGRFVAALVDDEAEIACCWNAKTHKTDRIFSPSGKPVGFTANSKELVTYRKGVATVWNLTTGDSRRFDVPSLDDIHLSPDGTLLAGAADDCVILVEVSSGKAIAFSADPPGLPTSLAFTDRNHVRGRLDAWGGWIEWDLSTKAGRLLRCANASGLSPVALSADGRRAIYRGEKELSLREMGTGRVEGTASVHAEDPHEFGATLSGDGRALVYWNAAKLVVRADGQERSIAAAGASGSPVNLVLSSDPRLAAVALNEHNERSSVELFDLAAGTFMRRIAVDGDVGQIALTPDGTWLAVAHDVLNRQNGFGQQGVARVHDLHSGRVVLSTPPDDARAAVIALSPNGRSLARFKPPPDEKGIATIVIWDVLAGAVRKSLQCGGQVSAIAFSPDSRLLAASVQGAPAFVWDLYPWDGRVTARAVNLERPWEDLRSANGEKAFSAMQVLGSSSRDAVPFLRSKVAPVQMPPEERVRGLIADLDHREYRRRESATRALADFGDCVRGPLEGELKGNISSESRERIEKVLAKAEEPTPELLRMLRAVEVLEVIGGKDCAEALSHWSSGAEGARLTREAKAAAKRMAITR